MIDRAHGLTAARGFRAAEAPNLVLLVNDGPMTAAAGAFTRHADPAAPVLWSQQVLTTGALKALIHTTGCANAHTGPLGFQATHATAEHVADVLALGAIDVAVCSTGPTGTHMDVIAVRAAVDAAAANLATAHTAANQAALTDPAGWTVGGVTADAVSIVTSDAAVSRADADHALRAAVDEAFTPFESANDTALLLVSGASGVAVPTADFTRALTAVCADLAAQAAARLTDAASATDATEDGESA